MECYLIRHGATQGNREGRYVGRTDEPVLGEELEALKKLGNTLLPVAHVYTSPYLRCRKSAEALFQKKVQECGGRRPQGAGVAFESEAESHPFLEIIPELGEMDFGAFEYKNYQELNGNPEYQRYIDSGGKRAFPGGEAPEQFKARCRQAFFRCIREAEEMHWQRVGFVVHGGTIMAIMEAYAELKKGYFAYQVKNGCGYAVEIAESQPLIIKLIREIG